MKNNISIERAIVWMTQQQLVEQIGVGRQTINAVKMNKYHWLLK
jgi:putative transcriptional regulator